MMARQHVTFAMGVYTTSVVALSTEWSVGPISSSAPLDDWNGAQPLPLLLSAILVGLGALVPDLDHPNSTLTRKLGWIGKILYPVIAFLSGGHRRGMHSIFLVATMGALFYGVSVSARLAEFVPYIAAVLVWIAGTIIAKFVIPGNASKSRAFVYLLLAIIIGLSFSTEGIMDGYWLAVAAAAGPLLHDLGDWLTEGRISFLWPITRKFPQLPSFLRFPTGGWFETVLLRAVFTTWSVAMLLIFCIGPVVTDLVGQATI